MELLIVIGVLGILAAGLLAAIDPFEQLKKARDSNYRSGAIELLSATQRYYANHGYMPWRNEGSTCATDNATTLGADADADTAAALKVGVGQADDLDSCITDLINDGELKSTFTQGLNTTVYLSSWSKTNVRVCYSPESKSNRSDAQVTSSFNDDVTPNVIEPSCTADQRTAGECVQCFQ